MKVGDTVRYPIVELGPDHKPRRVGWVHGVVEGFTEKRVKVRALVAVRHEVPSGAAVDHVGYVKRENLERWP